MISTLVDIIIPIIHIVFIGTFIYCIYMLLVKKEDVTTFGIFVGVLGLVFYMALNLI